MLRFLSIPLLLMLGSVVPLGLALLSQYGFGLHPCELCLWQRVPYALLIPVAVAAWALRRQPLWLERLLLLAVIGWLAAAGLAFYHVGVEQGWWESAAGCATGGGQGQSLEELRAAILNAPLVACDQPAFEFLGLSMAAWNTGFAAAIALYGMIWLYRETHRRRRG